MDLTPIIFSKSQKTVSANSSGVIYSKPLAVFKAANFSLSYTDVGLTKQKHLKIDLFRVDNQVCNQVYARGGNTLDIGIESQVVNGEVRLVVTNNEAFDVNVCCIRANL